MLQTKALHLEQKSKTCQKILNANSVELAKNILEKKTKEKLMEKMRGLEERVDRLECKRKEETPAIFDFKFSFEK